MWPVLFQQWQQQSACSLQPLEEQCSLSGIHQAYVGSVGLLPNSIPVEQNIEIFNHNQDSMINWRSYLATSHLLLVINTTDLAHVSVCMDNGPFLIADTQGHREYINLSHWTLSSLTHYTRSGWDGDYLEFKVIGQKILWIPCSVSRIRVMRRHNCNANKHSCCVTSLQKFEWYQA